jgi:ribosomal protein L40E
MRYFLLIISILIIIAISYTIIPQSAYAQTGVFHSRQSSSEGALRQAAPTNKTWLILLGTLAGFALLFLLVLEIGGGGLFPPNVEDMAAKICVGIIAMALCLYAYYMTENILFIILIPFIIAAISFMYFKKTIKKIYMKNFAQASGPNSWICRKCGAENSIIINECYNCNNNRFNTGEAPAENGWICENCKNINSAENKSCEKCGMRREDKN